MKKEDIEKYYFQPNEFFDYEKDQMFKECAKKNSTIEEIKFLKEILEKIKLKFKEIKNIERKRIEHLMYYMRFDVYDKKEHPTPLLHYTDHPLWKDIIYEINFKERKLRFERKLK